MSHKKEKLLKKSVPKNPTTHTFFSKLQKNPHYFFSLSIQPLESQRPQHIRKLKLLINMLFNFTSNVHMNWVYQISNPFNRFQAISCCGQSFPALYSIFHPCLTLSNHFKPLPTTKAIFNCFHKFPPISNSFQSYADIFSHLQPSFIASIIS